MSCAGECEGQSLSAISYLYPALCVVIGGVTVARFVMLRRILYADGALPSTGPVVYQQVCHKRAHGGLPLSQVVPCIVPVLFVILFFNWTTCVCRQPNRRPNLGVSCACSRKAGGCVTLRFNEVSLLCLAKSYPGTKLPGVTLNKTHNLTSNITLSHRISMLLVTRDHSGMQPWQRRA